MLQKCDEFLSDYLPNYPQSGLLDIIYKYDLSLTVNNYLEKVKKYFNIIFTETIEKYVFLRLPADDLYNLLKLRSFKSSNEYYFVKGISLWMKYDFKNRLNMAESLFRHVNCGLCDKNIMLQNTLIDTGNSKLNEIFHQLHLSISILNDNTTLGLLDNYKVKSIKCINIPNNLSTLYNTSVNKNQHGYHNNEYYYNRKYDYDNIENNHIYKLT